MAYTLDRLIKDLQSNKYVPKTQEELQRQAQNRYRSVYDQKRLAAQQGFEASDLALAQHAERTGKRYQKQLDHSARQYRQAYSQADRQMLGRGMQRSSYGAQVLGNIDVAGAKAADEIRDNQNLALGQIGDQRALLAQQLAKQLESYTGQQAADTLAYMDELESREYDRGERARTDANSLAAQIYQYANQERQQDRQQQQFDESVRQYNQNFAEQQRQFDASITADQRKLDEQIRQFNASLTEQQRQYDTSTAEGRRQFEASITADQRKLDEQIRQFNASLTEQQRQYDTSTAEGRRQFEASLTMEQKKLDEQIRQFEEKLAEEKRQFDLAKKGGSGGSNKTSPPPEEEKITDDGVLDLVDQGLAKLENKEISSNVKRKKKTDTYMGLSTYRKPLVKDLTVSKAL